MPAKIVSFQAFDELADPPVVILIIDIDLPSDAFLRKRSRRFLRRNNDTRPAIIDLPSSSAGLSSMPQPVTDGNAVADASLVGADPSRPGPVKKI
jgi:hypothetical protein